MPSRNPVSPPVRDAIAPVLRPGLPHVVGALPQLLSYSAEGVTVFALTVCGVHQGADGGTLVGPAVSPADITSEWPGVAQDAAKMLFEKTTARMAGAVLVILIVRAGLESHCAIVNVPAAGRAKLPARGAGGRGGRRHRS